MLHWQFPITYISPSVSLKFQTYYITGQWGEFTVKIRMLLYTDIHICSCHFFFLFFFVLHQIFTFFIIFTCFFERVSNFCNRILINCSSETGNIQVIKNCQCNCLNGLFQKKNTRRGWGHGIFRGIEKTKCGNSTGQGEEYTGLIKKHHV